MNYIGVFPDKVLFEQSFRDDVKSEVYGPRDAMTADTINFVRVKKLWGDKEEFIAPMKSGLILDGGRRTRYANGGMDYGTFIYPRNGNKYTMYRCYQHPSGKFYDEMIYEDDKWKRLLSYKFNESSLNWRKLDD